MSNHVKLFLVIIALVLGSIYAVATLPVREGLDLQGGIRMVLQADYGALSADKQKQSKTEIQRQLVDILRSRVDAFGVSEPVIQTKGDDQLIVELPGIKDEDKALKDLRSTAQLEFRYFRDVQSEHNNYARYRMSVVPSNSATERDDYEFVDARSANAAPLSKAQVQQDIIDKSPLIVSGADLLPNAKADYDPNDGKAVVSLTFNKEGTKKFADFTRAHSKEYLAIILDKEILMVPVINEPILSGKAQISGGMDVKEAARLAGILNAGALPVPLKVQQLQSVAATLGRDAVDATKLAGIVGLIAVLLFMILYYRLPGFLAAVALVFYSLFSYAAFKLIPVTLTLPGIAGFILSIGMAVDANILIFERLKEELRSGKTLKAAIDAGFARAWTSIRDSNICSLITAAILFQFGTGPIKGFAMTLGVGVLISMFTAITVTRTLLHLLIDLSFAQNPRLYGLGVGVAQHGRWYDIIGKRNLFFGLSGLVIVPGLIFLMMGGLKPGIDFKGGSVIQVQFDRSIKSDVGAVRGVVAGAGFADGGVTASNNNVYIIRTQYLEPEQVQTLKDSLASKVGKIATETVKDGSTVIEKPVFDYSTVGPVVSKELTKNAVKAVLLSSLIIVLYLAYQFAQGGYKSGFRYGMSAIIATLHDVLVLLGIFAILGYLRGWEVDSLFVTAVLTVIGFSTHDTIVIFDRIRENWKHREKDEAFEHVVNRSILQTFARSINTSLTVILTLTSLLILGGESVKLLNWALLLGVITGTYSSIFNASPILVIWDAVAARRSKGGAASGPKPGESKVMVNTPMPSAAPKPIERATESQPSGTGNGSSAPATEAKAKVKPKRNKKRF